MGTMRNLAGLAALLASLLAIPVAAARDRWSSNGPFGAAIGVISVDPENPSVIYAGSSSPAALFAPYESGLWKTSDGGAQWRSIESGLAGFGSSAGLGAGAIEAIAVDPSNSAIIYVGTGYAGIFKSTNGGDDWNPMFSPCTGSESECGVHALAVDPSDPRTIYVGTESGLFRSDDGAEIWSSVPLGGFTNDFVTRIVFDPSDSTTTYVGTSLDLFRSEDGGETWDVVDGGHVEPGVRDVVVDPGDGSILYLVDTDFDVFRLSDKGSSWQSLPAPLGMATLAVDVAEPDVVYGARLPESGTDPGIWRSDDAGAHWTSIGNSAFDGGVATIAPTGAGEILVGTLDGMFASGDRGATWRAADHGIADVAISAIAVGRANPENVFSGGFTYGGSSWISETTSGGRDWTMLTATLDAGASNIGPSIAVDPLESATVYAVTGGRLLKSSDGGNSWSPTGQEVQFGLIAADPRQEGIVYDVAPSGEVATSADGGSTWIVGVFPVKPTSALSPLVLSALVVDPLSTGTLYVSGDFGAARSSDFGISWTLLSGLPTGGVSSFAASPFQEGTLFAGRFDGVYRSTDGGESWQKAGGATGEFAANAIVADPGHQRTVYAGGDGGVFVSQDLGDSWSALSSGYPAPLAALSLALDAGGTRLYVGTSRGVLEWTPVMVAPAQLPVVPARIAGRSTP